MRRYADKRQSSSKQRNSHENPEASKEDAGQEGQEMLRVYVGYDPREASAYHTFCNSIIKRTTKPVSFCPLALNTLHEYEEHHKDGSNAFIYSRFLVPHLQNYTGWAIFADGDMICNTDISELFALCDNSKAVMVVHHDYKTKFPRKYLGNKNQDYPRKNWSSVILWNCGHPKNKTLTPEYIQNANGAHLHRFAWLDDSEIGYLQPAWNWLVEEYSHNDSAKILHYTVGTPCFEEYADCDHSDKWWNEYQDSIAPIEAFATEVKSKVQS
jgi:lipopolysaccharide biosynthesis glycosyltransferase